MTATTHSEFNANTEGLEVAKAFADNVRGKTVLITGVNRQGLGFTTAQAFASQSAARIIVAGRSLEKLKESIDALRAEFPNVEYRPLQVDLSSQKSVRAAGAEVLAWSDVPAIDMLINSAGVMVLPERTLSVDGIEMHFATNHIGHFLLACSIMPKLIAAAEKAPKGATRIVNVSALSAVMAKAQIRFRDINFDIVNKDLPETEQPNYDLHKMWGTKDSENLAYVPIEGYCQSKVANVLFGIGANKRLYEKYGILSLALHPGVFVTELGRNASPETKEAVKSFSETSGLVYRTVGAGASTSMVAALDPKLGLPETKNGKENYGAYLVDCQISDQAQPLVVSSAEAEKLWALSEKLVNEKFEW